MHNTFDLLASIIASRTKNVFLALFAPLMLVCLCTSHGNRFPFFFNLLIFNFARIPYRLVLGIFFKRHVFLFFNVFREFVVYIAYTFQFHLLGLTNIKWSLFTQAKIATILSCHPGCVLNSVCLSYLLHHALWLSLYHPTLCLFVPFKTSISFFSFSVYVTISLTWKSSCSSFSYFSAFASPSFF